MPTRTIDTQVFEGETIQCAKFVSDEPFSWKAAQIVQSSTDYEFQMVAKSSVATTLTIQVGDTVKTQDITTEFTRFVIPFPSVTNDVDSLYITFPSGTYWLYNLQLERASTPSAWRPAPEDAEDYADKASQKAVDDQTQLDVFNKLTNNGASQGIYLLDGQLYINGEYIAANTINGDKIQAGTLNANRISGGTITGVEMNIGNGVFTVDGNGRVNASNINMTGGSINMNTSSLTDDKIVLTYSDRQSTYSAGYVSLKNNSSSAPSQLFVGPASVYAQYNNVGRFTLEATSLNSVFQLRDTDGILQFSGSAATSGGSLTIFRGSTQATAFSVIASASNPQMRLYDTSSNQIYFTGTSMVYYNASNKKRVELTATGLRFYDANGNLTKTYAAT